MCKFKIAYDFVLAVATESLQFVFFFNDTATTEIYTLSLHDALPIYSCHIDIHSLYVQPWSSLYTHTPQIFSSALK